MQRCDRCGQENPEAALFCLACGLPLQAARPAERRKLATLVFCDLTGSTAMGERVDAESVRVLMQRFFAEMRAAIQYHGGTVEKFVGDAVMAVFGVPTAHEDDALRALRAAAEMRDRVATLNEEFERRFGTTISVRIGVNTGEVIAGDASARETMVTGDPVNVTARLEQAAKPGEILIGALTRRLAGDTIHAEALEPLALKGKSAPVEAHRLLAIARRSLPTASDRPMVGRGDELMALQDAVASTIRDSRGGLVTVIGEPGVGKSRLSRALVSEIPAGIRVLSGRCLPYGDGATFWPVAEIVRQLVGIADQGGAESLRLIEAAIGDGEAAERIGQAIGLTDGTASLEEIGDAVARLLAIASHRGPLLILIDDLQWAEDALLDLVASLPELVRPEPILTVCLAREELVDRRPDWTATMRLRPLDEAEAGSLIDALLGGVTSPATRARIDRAAQGNPLFLEELVAMLIEDGVLTSNDGTAASGTPINQVAIPPTLQALLGARLDRLSTRERATIERASIEGEVFHREPLYLFSPTDRAKVTTDLDSLLAKNFLKLAHGRLGDRVAFGFRHILIREAAYAAASKRLRAEVHEQLAGWIAREASDGEWDEIVGHHFEQAHALLTQLGPEDDHARSIAGDAARRLEAAGRRAFNRRDSRAAVSLLSRALALLPKASSDGLEMLQSVAEELGYMAEYERADAALVQVMDAAAVVGNATVGSHARLWRTLTTFWLDPEFGAEGILRELDQLSDTFEQLDDDFGRARAHDLRAFAYTHLGRFAAAASEANLAIAGMRKIGDRRSEVEQLWYLVWAAASGPEPVDRAIARCRRILRDAGDDRAVRGHALYSLATLEARRGHFERGRDAADAALAVFDATGMVFTAWHPLQRGVIDLLAGDAIGAEGAFRRSLELLGAIGDRPSVSTAASLAAEALLRQGRTEEADQLTSVAAGSCRPEQAFQQARWRAVRAKILARRGEATAAAMAYEAIEFANKSDSLVLHGDCQLALAEVLTARGDRGEANDALRRAVDAYQTKGDVVSAAYARATADSWSVPEPAGPSA